SAAGKLLVRARPHARSSASLAHLEQQRRQFLDETSQMTQPVSAIIATVGRSELLRLCLERLTRQTIPVCEAIVVHCGDDVETKALTSDPRWNQAGLDVRYFHHPEKNCAQQRNFAIEH